MKKLYRCDDGSKVARGPDQFGASRLLRSARKTFTVPSSASSKSRMSMVELSTRMSAFFLSIGTSYPLARSSSTACLSGSAPTPKTVPRPPCSCSTVSRPAGIRPALEDHRYRKMTHNRVLFFSSGVCAVPTALPKYLSIEQPGKLRTSVLPSSEREPRLKNGPINPMVLRQIVPTLGYRQRQKYAMLMRFETPKPVCTSWRCRFSPAPDRFRKTGNAFCSQHAS